MALSEPVLHRQRRSRKKIPPVGAVGGLQGWKQQFVARVRATFGDASENPVPEEQFAAHGLKDGPPAPDSCNRAQPLRNHLAGSLLLGKKKKGKREKKRKKIQKREKKERK